MTVILTDNPDAFTSVTPLEAVFGMGGNDTLTASAGGNLLAGGTGADKLLGGNGADTLFGDDALGGNDRNILLGKGGNDSITSYSSADSIDAGSGNDTVVVFATGAGQVVDGSTGTDTLQLLSFSNTTAGISITLRATAGLVVNGVALTDFRNFEQIVVTGGTGGNVLVGGGLDDVLNNTLNNVASFKAGLMDGGDGNDALSVFGFVGASGGVQTVEGGLGTDTFTWANGAANGKPLVVNGTAGTIAAGGKVFVQFAGIEVLRFQTYSGYSDKVTYTGIAGRDEVDIFAPTSSIKTGDGNDAVVIETGVTTVSGGAGDDVLSLGFDNTSAHSLNGDAGNDMILGGSGRGSLEGGGGLDTILGGLGQSTLYGGDGADSLVSTNSHAQFFGGTGNDTVDFANRFTSTTPGNALIDGGDGRDLLILDLSRFAGPFKSDLSQVSVTLADGTVIRNVEGIRFTASNGADVVTASNDTGGASFNVVNGLGGNDKLTAAANGASLSGGDGLDTLIGAAGADVLNGGTGNDSLTGGTGKDRLAGGSGTDRLTGGADADTFYFAGGDTSADLANADRILDFDQLAKDKIDVQDLRLEGLTFIGTKSFTGKAGELRFDLVDLSGTANDHTQISIDLNGDRVVDATIDLAGLITLKAGDFILI